MSTFDSSLKRMKKIHVITLTDNNKDSYPCIEVEPVPEDKDSAASEINSVIHRVNESINDKNSYTLHILTKKEYESLIRFKAEVNWDYLIFLIKLPSNTMIDYINKIELFIPPEIDSTCAPTQHLVHEAAVEVTSSRQMESKLITSEENAVVSPSYFDDINSSSNFSNQITENIKICEEILFNNIKRKDEGIVEDNNFNLSSNSDSPQKYKTSFEAQCEISSKNSHSKLKDLSEYDVIILDEKRNDHCELKHELESTFKISDEFKNLKVDNEQNDKTDNHLINAISNYKYEELIQKDIDVAIDEFGLEKSNNQVANTCKYNKEGFDDFNVDIIKNVKTNHEVTNTILSQEINKSEEKLVNKENLVDFELFHEVRFKKSDSEITNIIDNHQNFKNESETNFQSFNEILSGQNNINVEELIKKKDLLDVEVICVLDVEKSNGQSKSHFIHDEKCREFQDLNVHIMQNIESNDETSHGILPHNYTMSMKELNDKNDEDIEVICNSEFQKINKDSMQSTALKTFFQNFAVDKPTNELSHKRETGTKNLLSPLRDSLSSDSDTENFDSLRSSFLKTSSIDQVQSSPEESMKLKKSNYLNIEMIEIDKSQSLETDSIEIEKSPVKKKLNFGIATRSKNKSSENKAVGVITIYPPPPTPGGISINVEDYKCLGEGEFLNDVIIDFYLKYLVCEKLSPEQQKNVHVFSSHFFTRLTSKGLSNDETKNNDDLKNVRHEGVKRWTKNVNIFEKDFIIIPINQRLHWFLVIICYLPRVGVQSSQNEWPRPCIIVMDSLYTRNKTGVIDILRGYLSSEYFAKFHEAKDFSRSDLKPTYPKVPTQTNATDCGLFVLQYAENFIRDFINKNNKNLQNLSDWFESQVIMNKRKKIANLIVTLSSDYAKEQPLDLPKLKFPNQIQNIDSSSNYTNRRSIKIIEPSPMKENCSDWIKPQPQVRLFRNINLQSKLPKHNSKLTPDGPNPLRKSLHKREFVNKNSSYNNNTERIDNEWDHKFKDLMSNSITHPAFHNSVQETGKTLLAMANPRKKKFYTSRKDEILDSCKRKTDSDKNDDSKKFKNSSSQYKNPNLACSSKLSDEKFYRFHLDGFKKDLDLAHKLPKIPKIGNNNNQENKKL